MTRTLVVSAWAPEIAPLDRLARRGNGQARDRGLDMREVGVGGIDAGIGAAGALAAVRPERVIFVGTAGAYPKGRATLPVGTVAIADEVVWISTAQLRGDGYFPAPAVVRATPAEDLTAALEAAAHGRGMVAAARAKVACPAAIVRSATLGRHIARTTGAAVENLEAFAVARAAAAAGVVFAAVLGIANHVGSLGHREWLQHHHAASRAACRVVWRFLRDEQ